MYNVKMGMAILSWNGHVDRPSHPCRDGCPQNTLVASVERKTTWKKSYVFVEDIWEHMVAVVTMDPNELMENEYDHDSGDDSDSYSDNS
jgi:hypothetical protein